MRHARRAIANRAMGNPRGYSAQYPAATYRNARENGADETGRSLATYPEACPWSIERGLDEDFWPEVE